MTDNAAELTGLQLGRALVLELGEEQAQIFLSALRLVKGWTGVGEVRTNIRDGQVTHSQPSPVIKTSEQAAKLPPPSI